SGPGPKATRSGRISEQLNSMGLALARFLVPKTPQPLRGDSNMTLVRTVLVSSNLVLAILSGGAEAQQNARAAGKMVTLQMPAIPDPVPVTLDPKTSALMVLDYVEPICSTQPSCKDKMLPAMTAFMERVRKAGLTVAYGTREQNMSKWLKEVAPAPSDIK